MPIPSKDSFKAKLKDSYISFIDISECSIPKFFASNPASSMLISAVKSKGIIIVFTLPFPSASYAIAAVRAESIPPEEPINTPLKLFFST